MAVGSVNAIPHLTVDLHQDMEWNIRTTLVRRSGCDLAKESLGWMKCSLSKYSSNSELFHQPTLMHNFLYLLTICMLHYYARHVSSINMPIFRRKIVFTQHLISSLSVNVCTVHSVLCRRLQRAKIPDAVWMQIFLLKMGMLMLETLRG